jgi:hypothetical protein
VCESCPNKDESKTQRKGEVEMGDETNKSQHGSMVKCSKSQVKGRQVWKGERRVRISMAAW